MEPRPCRLCEKSCTTCCVKCRSPYCSKECQKKDWKAHKWFCNSVGKEFAKLEDERLKSKMLDATAEKLKTVLESITTIRDNTPSKVQKRDDVNVLVTDDESVSEMIKTCYPSDPRIVVIDKNGVHKDCYKQDEYEKVRREEEYGTPEEIEHYDEEREGDPPTIICDF